MENVEKEIRVKKNKLTTNGALFGDLPLNGFVEIPLRLESGPKKTLLIAKSERKKG